MKVPASSCYNKTMKTVPPDPSIKALYDRLSKVNTQLNAIEEEWPWRPPTTKKTIVSLDYNTNELPKYAIEALKAQAQRLRKAFPEGWEFTVRGHSWGGRDSGCMMEVFINGSCFSSVRFYAGDEPHIKTRAHCIQECTNLLFQLITNTISRLEKYPLRTFRSKRYERLCEQRRKLNQKWHSIPQTRAANVPGPWAYPYGEHKPGWPVFEGMQLGK